MAPFALARHTGAIGKSLPANSTKRGSWGSSYRALPRQLRSACSQLSPLDLPSTNYVADMGQPCKAPPLQVQAAQNIFSHAPAVSRKRKEQIARQISFCLWCTGTSASGKTAVVRELEQIFANLGFLTSNLDGDNLRKGLNSNLGFSMADRNENLRRTSCAAKLAVDSAVIVLAGLISPLREQRLATRAMFAEGDFILVHVDTPLQTCIDRDPNGLYKKALAGEIPNFTGINSPYEAPVDGEAQIVLKAYSDQGGLLTPREHAKTILEYLWHNGYLTRPGCSSPDITLDEVVAVLPDKIVQSAYCAVNREVLLSTFTSADPKSRTCTPRSSAGHPTRER
ncbi:hypothetical protein WJX73_002577 [Symbiochloris irregularis]|uniref:Adenylyl-sulfate kinase n=1 Tax=Symbiochloris irregularis TaxID=706552 RepID=A0AAW1P7C8_9CHLO